MRIFIAPKITLVLSEAFVIFALLSVTHGQGDIKGRKGIKKTTSPPGTSAPNGKGATAKPARAKVRVVEVVKYRTPNTGALTVVAEPSAHIQLKAFDDGEVVAEGIVSPNRQSMGFENIEPGRYVVVGDLVGYREARSEYTVKKGIQNQTVELNLVPITFDVSLSLNASSGMIMYGESSYERFENNRAVLPGLRPGAHKMQIKPDDRTYKTMDVTINVSETSVNHKVDLKRTLTTQEFNWASGSDWEMSSGWSVASRKITVNGKGVALPRDDSFRYYQDFQLITNIKMVNGVAASFALRTENPQNYYLVQLTGPNADERHVLRGFIVKNNVPQRLPSTFTISSVSEILKPGKFFRIFLTMKGHEIEVKVEDSETGEGYIKLGTLTDPGETFPVGAVGIVARDNEQNEVEQFVVCPTTCSNK